MAIERYSQKYSGYASPYSGQDPVQERDYVEEPLRNNPTNYPGEAKAAMPDDDEEFIPERTEMVEENSP